MFPKLVINLSKLRFNVDFLTRRCHEQGITVAAVSKVFCADKRIVELFNASEVDFIADSRIQNLSGMDTSKPKQLLRIAMPSEAENVVRFADISMQSELNTILALDKAARKFNKIHKIILMIDMGDLREGIFFENRERWLMTARAVADSPCLELYGIGVNLTCYGGILPDKVNLGKLIEIAEELRALLALPIPIISGGNSSMMTLLEQRQVPEGINQLRIGEAIALGNDTSTGLPMNELFTDCFVLEAELVEIGRKPSKPIGTSGLNAFGERVVFEDRGEMLRGILAIGRQDVNPDGLRCVDERVEILGASSDHLIVNLSDCGGDYSVGSIIRFIPDYGALLKLTTSNYVTREYIQAGID